MRTSPNRRFKDSIYEQFARLGKAVSAPKRLELIDLLCQGPRVPPLERTPVGLLTAEPQ